MIYKTVWFEWIIFILFINLIANIVRYKLYRKGKLGSFIFHVSFLVIVIGAFVTRNFGFEGMMIIPEGQAVNYMLSSETYVQIKVDDNEKQYPYDMPILVTEHTSNYFNHTFEFPGREKDISITYKDFLPKYYSIDTIKAIENGDEFLQIVTVGANGRKNNYLKFGTTLLDNGLKLSYHLLDAKEDAIQIVKTDSNLQIKPPFDITYLQMSDQSQGIIKGDSLQPFLPMRLYMFGGIQFVFNNVFPSAVEDKIESINHPMGVDNLVVDIYDGNESKTVNLPGGKGLMPETQLVTLNGLNYRLNFGSKIIKFPFAIYLKDFQLEKYPGTDNPSSYASEVSVVSGETSVDHRIYMNNVLDHGGYRFFQSNFDIAEDGVESTILSVNHDWWGTQITYLGYILMALGFVMALVSPKSRFVMLLKKSNEVRVKREKLTTLLLLVGLFTSTSSFSQHDHADHPIADEVEEEYVPIDKDHADKFGRVIIQSYQGRFQPAHTSAIDILKKVSRQDSYKGLDAMQVFVGLHVDFAHWFNEPMIYVSGDSTKNVLGIEGKYAKMSEFYDEKGDYKLAMNMEEALSKDKSRRSAFEKNFIKTDERYSILKGVVMGFYLRIFPIENNETDDWYSPADNVLSKIKTEDSTFVNTIMSKYVYATLYCREQKDWTEADKVAQEIIDYQYKVGSHKSMPNAKSVEWEIWYNKAKLFKRTSYVYLTVGFLLLLLSFIQLFTVKLKLNKFIKAGAYIFLIVAGFHAFGLGLRWYLSGHAPWSNGYEAVVFISFIVAVAGILFGRKSKIVLGAAGILAWLMLFVAGMNNMDPQISNLVPVLKSYWLMIHVAIITGSYGFLGLSAVLGIINLFIDIFNNKSAKKRLNLTRSEITYINEMSMTIGLFMLTIGTFLGGVWANESWGRYWGWDAKETWALASVLVYTIILHFRFIPGLKSQFTFNLFSLWGFSSIIMTFYGVNYYLAGLHSYATGEPVPIPAWVPITVGIFVVISLLAWFNKKRLEKA
jgi:cytochrome c-type biogenesis protein CcsB